jgi:hypothetical protein
VLASRLGYRMTASFVRTFFGRVFNYPYAVFTEEMLRPEKQDLAVFADGVDNIVGTHKRVAESYFADGSVEMACPPLQGLLHIMAHGSTRAATSTIRNSAPCSRATASGSDWYAARLAAKQEHDIQLWRNHATYLQNFLKKEELRRRSATPGHPGQTGIRLGEPTTKSRPANTWPACKAPSASRAALPIDQNVWSDGRSSRRTCAARFQDQSGCHLWFDCQWHRNFRQRH